MFGGMQGVEVGRGEKEGRMEVARNEEGKHAREGGREGGREEGKKGIGIR